MSPGEKDRLFSWPFLLCGLGNLLQGLSFNLYLHFPGFLQDLGADKTQIGAISSVTAIAAIAVRPPLGRWMDRRGRRPVILVGGLLNTAVCTLYLTLDSLGPWIYVVRVSHGLAEALLFTGFFTLAADLVPAARRTEGLALFGVSGMLPISLGGWLGDAILAQAGYRELFVVAGATAALSLLLSLSLHDRLRASGRGDDEAPRRFRAVVAQRDLLPLWFVGTVFSLALTAGFVFLKVYVIDTGLGSVGLFFTSYTIAALTLRVFFGWLPDKVGTKRVLIPALSCLALGFVLLACAVTPRDVALAGLLCGVGHGYTFPILFSMVVTRAREADRGKAMALFTALFDVGVLIGAPSLGWIIDAWGYAAMFSAAAALVLGGALLFVLWDARLGSAPQDARRLG